MVKFGLADGDEVAVRRKQLLQKIQEDPDLPALGSAVSQVVQIASSSHEAVHSLANFILSDMALTQKVLSMANTVGYRTASGAPVTTISKAIFLLGFDAVKTIALTMLLVEGMTGKSAQSIRRELVQSLGASLAGRELARRSTFKEAEEAAVVGLFKNLGRLLVVMHDQPSYDEIMALSATGDISPAQAAMQVLGCSLDSLAESVLRKWQIPLTIIKALAPLPAGVVKVATARHDWLQQAAAFSAEAVMLLSYTGKTDAALMTRNLLARYGTAFDLDSAALNELLARVAEETQALTNTICPLMTSVTAPETKEVPPAVENGALDAFLLVTADSRALQNDQRHPSGKPVNARDLLLAGLQDATEMVASGRCKANDLIMLVLETLYHGMGFRFAAACIKDVKAQQFRARISLGEEHQPRQDGFVFPLSPSHDLFHLAMQNDVDVLISDAAAANVRALLPAWHTRLLPDAGSFIVLPLVVQKQAFGLIYADRACVAAEGVPPDEAALIKTLKAQIMTALLPR
ncbi:HDOD domain-containing protein [Sulfuriferula sp. AH1]|uniref:HDOD domain-containing protein n=1 Tax=Sulfuriferula sp. AH1 TaxID=1985873 RepID=UPI001CB8E60C|nr:HDOD domain-containing protein [Sulfuriferula sp. AH1]